MKLSPKENIQMPMKTVASLISLVAIGTWAFFGIQEKLNQHSTQLKIMEKDLVSNTEFRIKWPRGLLGSLPADSEQFMLIEELYKQTDKLQLRVDGMLHNEVNIEALNKAVEKLQNDVEKLKDKQREFGNGNNFIGGSRALHVLPTRIDRAHLYSRPKNVFMLKGKKTGREIGES